VARKSSCETLRSSTAWPSLLVRPITCPVLMPPPASTVVQALGKWSRPLLPLILGVRPNSPIQTTSVLSSSPRTRNSSSSVAQAGSSTPQRAFTPLKLFWCVSQPKATPPCTPLSETSTNGTPCSTSRRASKQP